MRLCVVSQQVSEVRTGVGTYGRSLIAALAAAGQDLTVVGRGDAKRPPPWPQATYFAVPHGRWDPLPERWLSFAWQAAALLRKRQVERRFDVVHFLDAREALFFARVCSGPIIGTVHDCYFAEAPWRPSSWKRAYRDWRRRYLYHHAARFLEKKSLGRLDLVIANSRYVARAVTEAYGLAAGRVRTIYPGPCHPWPSDGATAEKPRSPEVLFVGGNFQRKGLPTLLQALVQVRRRLPSARLRIVGDNPARGRMEALAADLGVRANVEFLGAVPHERLAPLYRAAWVAVLPSEVEGFGLALLEAMYFGLPVIGSSRGGSAELVRDGWNGYLVAPGAAADLAERLLALLTERRLREEMGARGREAAAWFTPERMTAETQAAYDQVIKRRADR